MNPLEEAIRLEEASKLFRLGMEAFGSAKLRQAIDLLVVALPQLSPEASLQVQNLLVEALAAQERRDFLLLADFLEYEIVPLLQRELFQCGE